MRCELGVGRFCAAAAHYSFPGYPHVMAMAGDGWQLAAAANSSYYVVVEAGAQRNPIIPKSTSSAPNVRNPDAIVSLESRRVGILLFHNDSELRVCLLLLVRKTSMSSVVACHDVQRACLERLLARGQLPTCR